MSPSKPKRSPKLTQEQWANVFEAYLDNLHCSLYSRAFSITNFEERRDCAAWMAEAVMEAVEHDTGG